VGETIATVSYSESLSIESHWSFVAKAKTFDLLDCTSIRVFEMSSINPLTMVTRISIVRCHLAASQTKICPSPLLLLVESRYCSSGIKKLVQGPRCRVVIEVLCYKPEGRGFVTQ
jgi:hypothetical protein